MSMQLPAAVLPVAKKAAGPSIFAGKDKAAAASAAQAIAAEANGPEAGACQLHTRMAVLGCC